MKIVGHGCSRRVFLIGRWAIKTPQTYGLEGFLRGWLHNRDEGRLTKAGWRKIAQQRWGFFWGIIAVYPRCEPLTRALTDAELAEFFWTDDAGCDYAVPMEDSECKWQENFGWLNGEIVAMDYA